MIKDGKFEERPHAATKEQLEARQQHEQHKRDEKEKFFERLMINGVWESSDEVDDAVRNLSKYKFLKALKAQIRLRSDILGCILSQKIVYWTATLEELKTYLKELIQIPIPDPTIINIIKDNSSIVGLKFNQKWSIGGMDMIYEGVIADIVHTKNKPSEYKCVFNNNENVFQTVAEILADIAVGDFCLYK